MKRLPSILLAGSLAFIVLNLLLRFSGVAVWDDAYFFIRYADNLIGGGEYTWNLGEEPTFGLTSPLYAAWVLLWRMALPLSPAAVLWWSSFSGGLLAAWAMVRLVNQVHGLRGRERMLAWWGLVHSLALTAPQLAVHFTSGMDTTLAIAAMALFLLQWLRWTQSGRPGQLLTMAILGGLLPFVRPELMVFTFVFPIWMLWSQRKEAEGRKELLIHLGTSVLVFSVAWSLCSLVFGAWVPLSFFVKGFSNPYGTPFTVSYRGMAFAQLGIFVLCHFFLIVLTITGWAWERRTKVKIYNRSDWKLLGLAVFLISYHTIKALPIMGYHQRFLIPLVPILYLLAAKNIGFRVVSFDSSDSSHETIQNGGVPRRLLVLLAIVIAMTWWYRPANLRSTWGQFSMGSVYHELGRNNWIALEEVAALPDEISVASTELGILGILLQDNKVIDLSGLLDPHLSRGFDAGYILNEQRPDLIYLPHPDYVTMRRELMEHPDFERLYLVFSEQELQSWMGVAIRRDSPWAEQLLIALQNGQSTLKN